MCTKNKEEKDDMAHWGDGIKRLHERDTPKKREGDESQI